MLFNGKTQGLYKGHVIDNIVALEEHIDGSLMLRLAKRCQDPKYRFVSKFSVNINPAMARALASRLIDWADLQDAKKQRAATFNSQPEESAPF